MQRVLQQDGDAESIGADTLSNGASVRNLLR